MKVEGEEDLWKGSRAMFDEEQANQVFFAFKETGEVDVMLAREIRFSSAVETFSISREEKEYVPLATLVCPVCGFDCRDPEKMLEHTKTHRESGFKSGV